jgi:hypothetical protein
MIDGEIDWRAVAREHRARLHSVCFLAAFAVYLGSGFALGRFLEYLRVSESWTETIALFIWLPLGAAAWWFKNRLEAWADRGLPIP